MQLAAMPELAFEEWRELLQPLLGPRVRIMWSLRTWLQFAALALPLLVRTDT